ncbi:hypothetical protein SLU01_19030 [Sporosarcina luteola]|uniref:Uncharacterized protein n=1 Tax=Sporosarcina luteola TaxID=582850 RepID=A0A511Z820_9BACL|nr:hypothetical protein [Sporosarcina luteola]GEN83591.1 hypothetical protein SLU01_19030 [Sporosarcina luteola]
MLKVQELQAMDYLLKWLLDQDRFPYNDKMLKLVIELNGTYWYGDFITYSNGVVKQPFIDNAGDVEPVHLYATSQNATSVLKKIRDTFQLEASRYSWTNPFTKIDDLSLLFNTLVKLVKMAEIEQDDSPIYPCLLNAKSLEGRLELPFINLDNETIKVVSIIEL